MQEEVQKKRKQIEMQKKGNQIRQEVYCKIDKDAGKLNNVFKILNKYNLTEEQRIFIITHRYMLSDIQIETIIEHFLKGYNIRDIQEKLITKMKEEKQKNIEETEESVER